MAGIPPAQSTLESIPTMSHNIQKHDRVISLEACWHKLETIVPAITFANSGLDWAVVSHPVTANGQPLEWKALFRADKNIPLHVFKDSYGIIQNGQVWDAMQAALQGVPHKVVTTGSLGDCRRTFISIQLTDQPDKYVRGDQFKSYLTFINSFDGFCTARLYGTDTRVVCQNTLDASLGSKGFMDLAVKHTTNAAVRFADMAKTVQTYLERKDAHFANLAKLATQSMSLATAENVLAGFVTDGKPLSVRSINQGKEMANLFLSGKGNVGETRYDLLNGVTEFYTHKAGSDASKNMASNMLGTYAKRKTEFLDIMLDNNELNAIAAQGERLLEEAKASFV